MKEGDKEYLIELVMDLVGQGCGVSEGREIRLDSMSISVYAEALRFLGKEGKVKIEVNEGRRVIGRWA